MAALSPAEKQRRYRERHAGRLAAQRPERVREQLQEMVGAWAVLGSLEGANLARGAAAFALRAGLIDEAEHTDLLALVDSCSYQ